MKTFVLIAALTFVTATFAQKKIDFLQRGRDFTNLFYNGKTSDIWMNLSPQMKKLFGGEDGILGFQLQIKGESGAETAVIGEHVSLQGGVVVYERMVTYQKSVTPMLVQWTFDPDGSVLGFSINSTVPAQSNFIDYQDKAALRLPFQGNWLVVSGGRSFPENHHANSLDQRFALDLAAIKRGRLFSGDGTRMEQYFCFGRPILAPADGTVVQVHDGVPDNPINAPFATTPPGNYVVIDLGNSEFIFLAHFKLGSFMVKAGDQVRAGKKLGKCGNSGNSPVPHLHVHMQNTPVLFGGEGLPMQFHNYLAQKKFVSAGELENGQTVRHKKPK
jgi:hypothetical protein